MTYNSMGKSASMPLIELKSAKYLKKTIFYSTVTNVAKPHSPPPPPPPTLPQA